MSTSVKKGYMTIAHVIIMFALMFIIGNLQPFGTVTPMGMDILGIFVGTLYGWLFLDLLWPSLIALVALGMTGYMTVGEAFSQALSSATGIQVIMTSVFAVALGKVGAVEVLSNFLLTRESLQKNPWLLVLTLFLTVVIGTIFGAGLALVFMIWSLVKNAAEKCGYGSKHPLVGFIMASAVILSFTASHTVPFRGGALLYLSFFVPTAGEIAYAPFMIFALTYTALIIAGLLFMARFVMKIDASGFRLPKEDVEAIKNTKITLQQKLGCTVMVAFFVVMMAPTFMPKEFVLTKIISGLGLLGVTTIALMLLALIRDDSGKFALKLSDCHGGVPWDIVWLICATMPLATAMESKECGLMETVVATLSPIFASMSPVIFMIVVMVSVGLLTQVTHNLVLGAMFIPFLTTVAMDIGANHYTLFMMLMFTLNCAYVTPAASMQSALIHGNETIGKKAAYTWGIGVFIVSCIALAVVGIPLGNILWP